MYRRIWAALLSLALALGTMPCARAADLLDEYDDLIRDSWYAQGVRYCLRHGLMNGYRNYGTHFYPDWRITRAQLATILWRMEEQPTIGLMMQYTDVAEGAWYAEAIRWATGMGLMSGYTALIFAPEEPLTREQLATVLWRYARYRNGTVASFPGACAVYEDADQIGSYAVEAMEWVSGMGILSGERWQQGKQWLRPQNGTTRAAAATILMRFCLDMGVYD